MLSIALHCARLAPPDSVSCSPLQELELSGKDRVEAEQVGADLFRRAMNLPKPKPPPGGPGNPAPPPPGGPHHKHKKNKHKQKDKHKKKEKHKKVRWRE